MITPIVALPLGVVEGQPPILEARQTFQRAFSLSPFTVEATALLLVNGLDVVVRQI